MFENASQRFLRVRISGKFAVSGLVTSVKTATANCS